MAVPDFVGSEEAVAVMVTDAGLGTVTGARYTPSREMRPKVALPPRTPLTAQVTFWSVELATVAENCRAAPVVIVAEPGRTVTLAAGGGGALLSLDVPQAAARMVSAKIRDMRPIVLLMVTLPLRLP